MEKDIRLGKNPLETCGIGNGNSRDGIEKVGDRDLVGEVDI